MLLGGSTSNSATSAHLERRGAADELGGSSPEGRRVQLQAAPSPVRAQTCLPTWKLSPCLELWCRQLAACPSPRIPHRTPCARRVHPSARLSGKVRPHGEACDRDPAIAWSTLRRGIVRKTIVHAAGVRRAEASRIHERPPACRWPAWSSTLSKSAAPRRRSTRTHSRSIRGIPGSALPPSDCRTRSPWPLPVSVFMSSVQIAAPMAPQPPPLRPIPPASPATITECGSKAPMFRKSSEAQLTGASGTGDRPVRRHPVDLPGRRRT